MTAAGLTAEGVAPYASEFMSDEPTDEEITERLHRQERLVNLTDERMERFERENIEKRRSLKPDAQSVVVTVTTRRA